MSTDYPLLARVGRKYGTQVWYPSMVPKYGFPLSPSVACLAAVAIVCKSVLLANLLDFALSVAQIVSYVCEVIISVVLCETEFTLTVPANVNLDTNNWRRNFRHDHGDFTRAIRTVQCKITEPPAK